MMERLPFVIRLETYYTINRSWDGVQTILPILPKDDSEGLWGRSILLNEDGKILIYQGQLTGPQIGQPYLMQPDDTRIPIQVDGRERWRVLSSPAHFTRPLAQLF